MDQSKKKSKILVIDDATENIDMLIELLKSDYMVSAARSGEKGLQLAEKHLPDLILLDIIMPEMDGYETCKRLKDIPLVKDIPVIFLTAKTDTEDIVKGFKLGAVDYVTKPFNTTELLARVQIHLELKFGRETIINQNNEKKELIHVLCHDLMNPISNIEGFLDLIYDDVSKLEKFKEYLNISLQNSKCIINSVRDMRALEENKKELVLKSYNFKQLLKEALMILQSKLMDKNLEIEFDIDDQVNVVIEKTSFVNSVLNNILSNAIKFSFPNSKIRISTKHEGAYVSINIQDYGIGMPDTLANDMFDVNKKTSRQGTSGENGTGFGMPLVMKYVSVYGGTIETESKEKVDGCLDHGTSIILKLKTELI
ncbi:hybrid sensor histidine kinase/response regulator [bacterium]|nr:hybrid sensor histidine kinase/response regulator [bacterium]